jgi:hypothetical protein
MAREIHTRRIDACANREVIIAGNSDAAHNDHEYLAESATILGLDNGAGAELSQEVRDEGTRKKSR